MSEVSYRCPKCGQADRFYENEHIDYSTVVIDAHGDYVSDVECYWSEVGDGSVMTCPDCGFEGDSYEFEEEE